MWLRLLLQNREHYIYDFLKGDQVDNNNIFFCRMDFSRGKKLVTLVLEQNKVKADRLPACENSATNKFSNESKNQCIQNVVSCVSDERQSLKNDMFNLEQVIQTVEIAEPEGDNRDETIDCSSSVSQIQCPSDNNFFQGQNLSTPEETTKNLERLNSKSYDLEFEEPFQSSGSEFIPDSEGTSEGMSDLNITETAETNKEVKKWEGRKKRGRKRKILHQSRADRKKFANTNQKYISVRDKEVEPKNFNVVYSCKCSKKCTDIVPLETRKRLFDQFWGVGSFEGRCVLITKCVKEIEKKRTYTKNLVSRRSRSKMYNIEDHCVCKEAFLNTLQINSNRVQVALKKMKSNLIQDKRGCSSGGRNAISQERIENIIKHISSFPTYISHYCRSQTDSQFLNPDLNLRKMYSLYQENTDDPVSLSKYKNIFYSNFNLKFKAPHKDTCRMCDTYTAELSSADNFKKQELEAAHLKHLQTAEELRNQMDSDISASQEDETVETLTFDLQKTHPIPKLPTGIVYYKRQLNLYNLGIFVGSSKKGIFNVWLEHEAGRGTQEVGSCLRKFVNENIKAPVKKLNLWSDSCGGQNRSIKLVLMLNHVLQNHPSLTTISLKFLLSGHSFLPNDSHFGDVECSLKTQQRLYTLNDYTDVMKACRRKNKFVINRITAQDMVSVVNLERAITNRKSDVNKEHINWLKLHEITLKKENPTLLFMKIHTADSVYTEVNIEKGGKGRKPVLKEVNLPPLWPKGKALSVEKIKDLKEILKLVPQDAKPFFNFLKTVNGQDFREDIEGIGADIDFEISDLQEF